MERADGSDGAPMRSPVNWALLGLIIEQPSYAYNLAQRFERRYGEVLPLSNIGHVYTALKMLAGRAMVEEIPGTREGRQPRPRYRATESGAREYREWLVSRVGEDRRRHQLFVLALAALAKAPDEVAGVMEQYEQAWLREGMRTPIPRETDSPADGLHTLLGRLLGEENRLAVGAKLAWIEYTRGEFKKLRGMVRRP